MYSNALHFAGNFYGTPVVPVNYNAGDVV